MGSSHIDGLIDKCFTLTVYIYMNLHSHQCQPLSFSSAGASVIVVHDGVDGESRPRLPRRLRRVVSERSAAGMGH